MPFDKHPDLIVRQEEPFNAEPPAALLCQSFVTPTNLFFVRNHGTVPEIDADEYRLVVDGLVQRPLSLSLDDLRRDFAHVTVTATLECAGNRRLELMEIGEIPDETPWGTQAISNAVWGGVPLREVLLAAGVSTEAAHIAFVGLDAVAQADGGGLGASISLEKAMHPEVLLAYEMNGAPLPPTHGAPLRVIVPGYIGARSVKWLAGISVQDQPSTNYFQARAYKLFPPDATPATADWNNAPMIEKYTLTAVICAPQPDARMAAGTLRLHGYALASAGRHVTRVEISGDGGTSWTEAELTERESPWTWCFWQAALELAPGQHDLVARAWDSGGTTQPEDLASVWNFKGYMNNAWYRVRVDVV